MSTPIIGPLVRTNYLNYPPGAYDASADPNSPAFNPDFSSASPVAPVVVSPTPVDGRSKNNNRALVDGGNLLIVNYARDYKNGVEIQSNLQVDDNLNINGILSAQGTPLMGNPARKAASVQMLVGASHFSGPGGTATLDVVLASSTHFTACMSPAYLQWYVSVAFNAAVAMDVFEVDGTNTPVTGTGGIIGTIFSPVFTGTGQTITFRALAVDDSVEMSAYGIVYFE